MIKPEIMRRLMIGDAVIDRGACPIIMIDADNIIIEVSKAFCALGGWPRESLIGSRLTDHIPDATIHPHNEPIDYLAEKYDGKQLPSITRVPMTCAHGQKQILLDLQLLIAEHPGQERPEFIAFVTEAEEQLIGAAHD